MSEEFKSVDFMRKVREENGEKHAQHPELLEAELAAIREQFKHLLKPVKRRKEEVLVNQGHNA